MKVLKIERSGPRRVGEELRTCFVNAQFASVVALCSFGFCVAFVLLQEGSRQLRLFVGRTMKSPRPPALEALIMPPRVAP